jgi:uncharacterized protein (DUF1697 family)
MPKYVAFLRAINVGGHTVKMDDLRNLFEALGFANVETFIASGNVIFDSKSTNTKALERKIEKHLQSELGYAVRTFLRSTAELAQVVRHEPFSEGELLAEGNVVYITFTESNPSEAVQQRLLAQRSTVDDFHINGREVYWLYRRLAGETRFQGPLLEKTLGMQATVRNSNTVRKIVAKYC